MAAFIDVHAYMSGSLVVRSFAVLEGSITKLQSVVSR